MFGRRSEKNLLCSVVSGIATVRVAWRLRQTTVDTVDHTAGCRVLSAVISPGMQQSVSQEYYTITQAPAELVCLTDL